MVRVDPAELSATVEEILIEAGASSDVARTVADALVEADLHGHHSHGVRLVPKYVERIRNGQIKPSASPEIVREDDTSLLIDGHSTLGQYVGQLALDEAVPKARENGIAIVGIRNGTHLGCIGTWARRTTAEGLAFVSFVCNPTSTIVAPPGSSEGRLSTNPITLGMPSFDALPYSLVADVATSQVAFGKIREAAAEGKPVPEEWTTEYEGKPDAQPVVDGEGSLLPLGGLTSGYKGFALSVMTEMIASNVGDALVSGEREADYGNSAAFVFVDPLRFTTEERIADRIEQFREYVLPDGPDEEHPLGPAAMGEEPMLPGEPEHRAHEDQSANGVDVRDPDARSIRELAAEFGLEEAAEALAVE